MNSLILDFEKNINIKEQNLLEKPQILSFKDPNLYKEAISHQTYALEQNQKLKTSKYKDNQRLEYLGDSIIGCITAEFLFKKYPNYDESQLTNKRTEYVQQKTLANFSRILGLDRKILLGQGGKKEQLYKNDKTLCDIYEAYIGALKLDQGFEVAEKEIINMIEYYDQNKKKVDFKKQSDVIRTIDIEMGNNNQNLNLKKKNSDLELNPKGEFQQLVQKLFKNTKSISYKILDKQGMEHTPTFKVGLYLDRSKISEALGKSVKEAEKLAAKLGFKCLQSQPRK